MNALIFKETKLKPLFLDMTAKSIRRDLLEVDGASIVDKEWAIYRTECVQWIFEYFDINSVSLEYPCSFGDRLTSC